MIKHQLNKLKFALGLDPKIEQRNDYEKYIPEGYKSVLIIYADFELAWAWRFSKGIQDVIEFSKKLAKKERENMPAILDVCDEFNIPVTWATVGHLFLNNCNKIEGKPHHDIKRPNYFTNNYWEFIKGDWFDADPCSNYKVDDCWYCPDLIELILSKKVRHEIGCHTFSHLDCTDVNCSPEIFNSDIDACKSAAKEFNVEFSSFVHPAHTIGNLDALAENGFTSYRTDYGNTLGYPRLFKNKLWEFKSTWEFVSFNDWSVNYHIKRYKEILTRSVKSKTVCVLWFHPSIDKRFVTEIMPAVFKNFDNMRNDVYITTASEYADYLNNNGKH